MRVLGLIPARGGSKGIPRKNLAPFAGKPLLAWTCEAALAAESLTDVVLTTDDEEIAAVGRTAGVEVPFLREAALADDTAASVDVVVDALQRLQAEGRVYDAVCLLQPTNPLRLPQDIDQAVALLLESDADSVVSVAPIPHEHNPHWAYLKRGDGTLVLALGDAPLTRRQDLPPAYYREGSLYVTRTGVVLDQRSLYGKHMLPLELPSSRSGGIDTPDDLTALEARMQARLLAGAGG